MQNAHNWYVIGREVAEILYFLSGIAIAVVAFFGLDQLRITRRIANQNAQREAIKLTVTQCEYFASTVLPALTTLAREYQRLKLTFVPHPVHVVIKNDEFAQHNFDMKVLDAEFPKIQEPLVTYANAMESFAIPFAAGIADDELGFQETAIPFCQGCTFLLPGLFQLKKLGLGRFVSVLRLYDRWGKRLTAAAIGPALPGLEEFFKSLKTAQTEKIKPLGTDN